MMKSCTSCSVSKPRSEYYRRKTGADGLNSICKECLNLANKRRYNKDRHMANIRMYKERHPERIKSACLKSRYGVSLDDYNRVYDSQLGCCDICHRAYPRYGRSGLWVDHCHDSNTNRGLLCPGCNSAIGKLNGVDLLGSAIAYFNKHNDPSLVQWGPL